MLALAALLLPACAVGEPATSDTPRRDFAGRPQVLPTAGAPGGAAASGTARPAAAGAPSSGSAGAAATSAPGTVRSAAPPPGSAPDPGAAPPAGDRGQQAGGPFRQVARLADPADDQGSEGPAYADVRQVVLLDDGSRTRVVVTMSGVLPARPSSSEAIGIGLDLYAEPRQLESDYQLFADGGPDGWFAYLHTPRGFVRYPGTFAVDGASVVFTVPWTSVGDRRRGFFKAFVDWTSGTAPGTLGGKAAANDRAPLVGTAGYAR